MKFSISLLSFLFLFSSMNAQTNDTPGMYKWRGKNFTEPQDGYVILKSGSRVAGMIVLKKDKAGNLEEITIDTGQKEIDLPIGSISHYGVDAIMATNTSKADMYEWGNSGEVMGKVIEKTKPRQGYVITQTDERFEGEMQLKSVSGVLDEITIKNEAGKEKFAPQDLKEYGLLLTIDELTKGGDKEYNQAGRNFSEGEVVMKNGETLKGWVAFREFNRAEIGNIYSVIMYAPGKDKVLKMINDGQVDAVKKQEEGTPVLYKSYEGGFLSIAELENKEYRDPKRQFNKGEVVLANGSRLTGSVSQVQNRKWYSTEINVKVPSGEIVNYGIDDVQLFTQEFEDMVHTYVREQDAFVELEFDGDIFRLLRNPNPTTVNEGATKIARATAGIAGEGIQREALKATNLGQLMSLSVDGDNSQEKANRNQFISNTLSKVNNMSNEELVALGDEMRGERTEQEYSDYLSETKTASAMQEQYVYVAITSELAFRSIKEGSIVYYEEWTLTNKKDNSVTILYENDYKDLMEPVLMGCLDYITMEKDEQKQYRDWDNRAKAVEFMNKCYGGN